VIPLATGSNGALLRRGRWARAAARSVRPTRRIRRNYFLSLGVGVVAMISQEDVEAFWIIHIDTTTGKVLASR
jgi:hypothetical protein